MKKIFSLSKLMISLMALIMTTLPTLASEADLVVPDFKSISIDSYNLLIVGLIVSIIGVIFGFIEFL